MTGAIRRAKAAAFKAGGLCCGSYFHCVHLSSFPDSSLAMDASVGYRDAWRILENYPLATFAVLDRAGHNLQIEQAGLFCALTLEWLERINEMAGQA